MFLINVPVGGAVLATVPMAAALVLAAGAVIAAATLRRHDATEPATV